MGMHVFIHVEWWLFELVDFRAWPSLMSATLANWTSFSPRTWFCKDSQIIWLSNRSKQRLSCLGDNLSPWLVSWYLASLVGHVWSRLRSPQKWHSTWVFFTGRESSVIWLNWNTLCIAKSVCQQLIQQVIERTKCCWIWLCKTDQVGCLLANKLLC